MSQSWDKFKAEGRVISEADYAKLTDLLDQRQKMQAAKLKDKAKLAQANATLETKVQSERYHRARIAELTAQIDAIMGEE